MNHDPVNRPKHYTNSPSGVECIQVTEHMNFCVGNAVKYLWRAGEKGDRLEDLKKARWYIDREIQREEKARAEKGAKLTRPDPWYDAAQNMSVELLKQDRKAELVGILDGFGAETLPEVPRDKLQSLCLGLEKALKGVK